MILQSIRRLLEEKAPRVPDARLSPALLSPEPHASVVLQGMIFSVLSRSGTLLIDRGGNGVFRTGSRLQEARERDAQLLGHLNRNFRAQTFVRCDEEATKTCVSAGGPCPSQGF